ncbi:hypothetical protein N7462_000095 [Penicillium macrosclerotiorum]|uniref:uncharacterized protein n=1 Tax=Penicillium macrosclerotiorum TaxID=303699 RepID=UPI00254956E3|nr:uncharacterized protein N7462_000095 [Penicillium macrosclerotiorum]KAJ5698090.1 hypothetical protein N7462_000095 [Penicillium macrosclerotiorum]
MVRSQIGALQRLSRSRLLYALCVGRSRPTLCLRSQPATPAPLTGAERSFSNARALRSVAGNQVKTEDSAITQNPPTDAAAAEEARLQAEVETYRNIRQYLRKWQETNPNVLDPVREAGDAMASENTGQWVGNMLNGREAFESLWSSSRLSVQDDFDTSQEFEGDHLEPGDLIARLSSDGIFNFAIYVQSVHKQKQFYTNRGNWRIGSSREIDYVVKGFADPQFLEPLKPYFPDTVTQTKSELQIVPEGGLPRPLGRPLIEMMAGFEEHILDFYRDHSKVLDDLHELVADESEFLRMTLDELTTKVLGISESELDIVNMFAVHQAVRRHPFIIERDSSSPFNLMYLVQPKRIAQVVSQVTTWVHEHQDFLIRSAMGKETTGFKDHPVQKFVQKAQRLIRLSRKVRSPTIMSSVGPSSQKFQPGQDGKPMVFREVLTERFSNTDQAIIEFLQLYAIPSVVMPSGTLQSTASHVMRATGMYNTLGLSDSSTRLFLQELGVVAPWENLSILDQNVLLPGHGMSLMEDMKWDEIQEACRNISGSSPDSMQRLRKDWGNLPIYCIDDANAEEIDDGVSIERISGSEDTFWVHIHVANPTAFMNHDDPIMQYAKSRLLTTYVPERTYPIFPKGLTQGHFSLTTGRPTLTFSAKMNLQGEILDTAITNGTAQNVISITHSTLREFLDPGASKPDETLTVGGEFTQSPLVGGKVFREILSTEDKENFTILRKLMLRFRAQRQKNGAMDLPNMRPNTRLSVQMGTEPARPYEIQITDGRYFVGDPIIQLRTEDFDPHEVRDQSKNYLVSLLMNLAGHIAGQFCAARNIPVVYDGTWYDPEYGHVTRENLAEFGGQSFYQFALPKSISSSSPVHHHVLGLDAYVKCTSPLRRFTDVIAHYQIEAALLFEHENGRQFNAVVDSPEPAAEVLQDSVSEQDLHAADTQAPPLPLPYSNTDINAHITFSQPLLTRLREISKFSTQHWACMLLFRAFYFAECPLPSSFPVILRAPRVGSPRDEGTLYSGIITNLGIDCVVNIPDGCPDKEKMDISGVVDAQIIAVDMATLEVQMEATGLVKAFERTGEWA